MYGEANPADFGSRSFYAEEAPPQPFYKWGSPPGLVRILEGVGLVLCLTIFACAASTLAWDYGGYGGYNMGYGNTYYGGGMGYSGGGLGYYGGGMGYYGATLTPRSANGFMVAMSALCFLGLLGLAGAGLTRSPGCRSRRFFLVTLVLCALLAVAMAVASVVYVVGVNPRSQMYGSSGYYYGGGINPMLAMCNQAYGAGGYMNQYLYHYCVVDPQEAIAIVCGFLLVILLCVICFFAHKTRQKIWRYGKPNIYWDRPSAYQEGPNVEEWVKNVNGVSTTHDETATLAYSEKPTSPSHAPASPAYGDYAQESPSSPFFPSKPIHSTSTSLLEERPSASGPSARKGRRRRWRRSPETMEESQYETDCTTAPESGEERDPDQWNSLYPAITSDGTRQSYKQEFDTDLKRYKQLCAEMDSIKDQIKQLSKELDLLEEGSLQYQGVAEEYNRLKDLKRTPDYQTKKMESRSLRKKLFHIKRMVSEYDKRQG
nr:occludin-like [Anolis sagrei ordinatus]